MIGMIGRILVEPSAWPALVSWPKFSLTSYHMVLALQRQGVVPKTIIDVGANVGQFAVASAKTFPDSVVHSFEPQLDCVQRLIRHTRGLKNVEVYPMALGAHAGNVQLHVNSHSHSSSILALGQRHRDAFPDAREVGSISVPLSTLDHELGTRPLAGPVLLKLDVQGYEPAVLQGAQQLLNRIDYVLLEASLSPMYEGELTFMQIVRLMEGNGFGFLRPLDWLKEPRTGEVLQMDALFAKPSPHVV
jgi:FkbM family methyltransferase